MFKSIVIIRHDPKVHETLGEAMRPQPEWWLNGNPFVKGQVKNLNSFLCAASGVDHVQIGQLQGNINVTLVSG